MADGNQGLSPDGASVVMFSGKGGVGKTTCAAATALHYASRGERTLAISTDATPSLSHIFEAPGDEKPKRIRGSLYVSELGVEEVEQMWDEKFGREVYDVFSSFVEIDYDEFVEREFPAHAEGGDRLQPKTMMVIVVVILLCIGLLIWSL